MNIPVHGTTSPDPSITSPLKSNARKSQAQRYHLVQPKHRQVKPTHTVWENTSGARRQVSSDPLFEGPPPGATRSRGFPGSPIA